MTDRIRRQILAIRDSGLTNMFDVDTVQAIANQYGFYELVVYLDSNRNEYANFILTGQVPEEGSAT